MSYVAVRVCNSTSSRRFRGKGFNIGHVFRVLQTRPKFTLDIRT